MELFTQLLNHIIKTYNASIYWIDDEAPDVFTHFVLRNDTTSFSLTKYKTPLVDLDLMSIKDLESENIEDAYNYFICAYMDAKCFDDYVSLIRKYFEYFEG